MNSKNLFLNKFQNFLLNENTFFKNYKKIYIFNFLQLLKKTYPQITVNEDIKKTISNFYNSLFINPSFKNGNFNHLIQMKNFLIKNKIDNTLLNKTFLLITNSYIKHIFSTSDLEKLKIFILLLDFYDKFITINLKDIKKGISSNTIPIILEKIYKTKSPIILFGVYKSIPISNKTKITSLNLDKNTIQVKANNYQLIASKFQKEIYLLDSKTSKTFKAYVKDIILYKKNLILTDIKEIKRNAIKRNYIRVQPKNTIYTSLQANNKIYSGKIYDLSVKGISVVCQKEIDLNINETSIIKFKLPINDNFLFNFTAELRSISHFDEFYRYHFYFEPTPKEEIKLEKYITKREKEIIFELTKYINQEFIEL